VANARLIITAVVLEGRTQGEVARTYGVSKGWVSKLLARYRAEGEAAFEPRTRRPASNPRATPPQMVELVLTARADLLTRGLDGGAQSIAWHLQRTNTDTVPSRATIHRILTRAGTITPQPRKRPKSSWHRFQADQPNECWQSDFTHYRLTDGTDTEILTWLDDHSRYALHLSAHTPVTARIVLDTFTQTCDQHGRPASTLTDNGMVYTARLAGRGRTGGRTALERHLATTGITQKNSRPHHPTTCGKVERFQQTMKNWLRTRPDQPTTPTDLNALLAIFADQYNHHRPHRALDGRTPAAAYAARPKATPPGTTTAHERVRRDKIDTTGKVTLRINSTLHKIGVGRAHARTPVLLLVQDHHVRVIHATTGELLRELTIDPTRTYQPLNPQKTPEPGARGCPMS
jgi:transposase InsO family protein